MNSEKHDLEDLKAFAQHHYGHHDIRTYKDAYTFFAALCAAGDPHALYSCGWLYLKGRGVPKDTEEGFARILKSACSDIENNLSLCVLAECYEKGVGVDKNPVEAYIWALMFYAVEYRDEADAQTAALAKELSVPASRKAEKEAGRRGILREEGKLTPEYCLAQAAKYQAPPAPRDKLTIIGRAVQTPEQAAGPTETSADDDDPEPSSELQYRYLKACRKHFDPALVELELVLLKAKTKHEEMDFDLLNVRYDGKNLDTKSLQALYGLRVNHAARSLLIRLALQNSLSNKERRAENVRRILSDRREADHASRLNKMFNEIFPGCSLNRMSSLIDRKQGIVKAKLKIDTTRVLKARDFPADLD